MNLLQVRSLHFGYGDNYVIKGANLIINGPELAGIIGANGCGKTTLLKNISGYLKPLRGRVLISNKEIHSMSIKERAQYIGYVPQEIPTDFAFTCYDLVMMGRTPHLKRFQKEGIVDRETVQEAMGLTHTWHLKDRLVTELSGGEKQRVYIARALAQQPQVLLLDEPVSHLDIRYQVEILSLLKELTQKGILVLAVLHDINLASQYCDKIVIMKNGKIISRGNPQDIINRKNISNAFSIDVEIMNNPLTDTPYVVPVNGKEPNLKVI